MPNLKKIKFNNKKIGILGLGITGVAALKFLYATISQDIYLWDDSPSFQNNLESTYQNLVKDIEDRIWTQLDYLFVSPGIATKYPEPHKLIKQAIENNIELISDIEILFNMVENNFIGITGTNGKSTTTSLIGHLLNETGRKNFLCGNIGAAALSEKSLQNEGEYIIEMSSFQLELINEAKFKVALLLNITPDHMDRYKTLNDYASAKMAIFNNQTPDDYAIIGYDNNITRKIYWGMKNSNAAQRLVNVSTHEVLENGISFINGEITDNYFTHKKYQVRCNQHLQGPHNAENLVFAIAAVAAINNNNESLEVYIAALANFIALPHRTEYLGEFKGVTYINDSKATNPESAIHAMLSFKNIHWIAGGKDKNTDLNILTSAIPNIKQAYFIGEGEKRFFEYFKNLITVEKSNNLIDALNSARKNAIPGDVILLSPACASYDQFKNFAERGKVMQNYLKNLQEDI